MQEPNLRKETEYSTAFLDTQFVYSCNSQAGIMLIVNERAQSPYLRMIEIH